MNKNGPLWVVVGILAFLVLFGKNLFRKTPNVAAAMVPVYQTPAQSLSAASNQTVAKVASTAADTAGQIAAQAGAAAVGAVAKLLGGSGGTASYDSIGNSTYFDDTNTDYTTSGYPTVDLSNVGI